jgi:hypothetical protein
MISKNVEQIVVFIFANVYVDFCVYLPNKCKYKYNVSKGINVKYKIINNGKICK